MFDTCLLANAAPNAILITYSIASVPIAVRNNLVNGVVVNINETKKGNTIPNGRRHIPQQANENVDISFELILFFPRMSSTN